MAADKIQTRTLAIHTVNTFHVRKIECTLEITGMSVLYHKDNIQTPIISQFLPTKVKD